MLVASLAMASESLLVFVNTNRKIRKHTDTVVAFTQDPMKKDGEHMDPWAHTKVL
jgi:hypothetical protein